MEEEGAEADLAASVEEVSAAAAPAATGNAKIPLNPPFSKGEIRYPSISSRGIGFPL